MLSVINDIEELLSPDNYKATVSSRVVAERFGKRHADVIRIISQLVETTGEFGERNFASVKYTDKKGEKRKEYQMTVDGFSLTVMGFSGTKATKFKVAYIQAFRKLQDRYLKLRKDYVSAKYRNRQEHENALLIAEEYMPKGKVLDVDKALRIANSASQRN